jgi:hypothetical protein
MNKMKKLLRTMLAGCVALLLTGCGGETEVPEPAADETIQEETMTNESIIIPTVYDNAAVVTEDRTEAGNVRRWQRQVFTADGGNNDMPTENAVIISPWHTLTIDGVAVPVYTARCGKGSHSFAWIDVKAGVTEFSLDVTLSVDKNAEKCVILPESRGVTAEMNDKTVTASISAYGSYTFTFAEDKDDAVTEPTLAPLTLMVTEEVPLEVPDGYKVKEIEPGYHSDLALEFSRPNMVYVMKPGLHEISSIRVPSNSILYIERGAYLQVTDRVDASGNQNRTTAIHMDEAENAKVISRGLLDCGKLMGADGKFKHVFNASRSKNVSVEGLTIINANTWSMCFYNCDNAVAERNLLLGYRMYSDGIMMSECRNSAGRYNFVRTGDDAMEFKGTGWHGKAVGENCVYEYNDLWTDKGAGYCLTWESSCDMKNMVFRNNSVGFAQPTWTDRNTALDCLLGTDAGTRWGDVLFENIEIYRVISPNVINNQITGAGAILDNITFRNISVKAVDDGVYAYRMHFSADGGSISNITIENMDFCGKILTSDDKNNGKIVKNQGGEFFDALTIK